eukprot:PhF_6_TR28236/c0_g1_i1/m.41765/K07560/dtd, DTD1; D-tyrosyl-tRNA(Tyr) deacylase
MRCVIQRVMNAAVTVEGSVVGAIGPGICVLVGIAETDTPKDLEWMANKLLNVRLFPSTDGKTGWALGVQGINGGVLLVSQFTLCHTLKGNKPDFHKAMKSDLARVCFDDFVKLVGSKYDPSKVQTGAFGEMMKVDIVNDGPVTLVLDYPPAKDSGASSPLVDTE